jgi:hypothetical protein
MTPEVPRNFKALADGLSLARMGGKPDTSAVSNPSLGSELTGGYATFKNLEIPKDPSGNEIKSSSQNITSVIMLDSRDRDRNVFVQPTNVTLRLPRIYSNITNFSLVQIKLLSAFYYFRSDKHNLNISILINVNKIDIYGLPNNCNMLINFFSFFELFINLLVLSIVSNMSFFQID